MRNIGLDFDDDFDDDFDFDYDLQVSIFYCHYLDRVFGWG
jgi:hypothetical protein